MARIPSAGIRMYIARMDGILCQAANGGKLESTASTPPAGRGGLMKGLGISVIISAFMLGVVATVGRPVAAQNQAAAPVHEIKMTVKKFEYSPAEIHVKQGEKVRLLITALDHKHGFELKDFNVKSDLEEKKET